MSRLPVTLIIPAYNCAGELSRHVEAVAPLIRQCEETLFVASKSPDGTHELAARLAGHHNASAIITPRGVFSSWNAGVRAATAKYCYFSTVGDVIDPAGLEHLAMLAESNAADLIISPPVPTDNNYSHIKSWPIIQDHRIFKRYEGRRIPNAKLIGWVYRHSPDCIIGSSASALYRHDFLAARPFPTTFHNYGDTAWTFKVCAEAAVVYSRKPVAHFVAHPATRHAPDSGDMIRLQSLCLLSVRGILRHPARQHLRSKNKTLSQAGRRMRGKWMESKTMLDARRGRHPRAFWWLSVETWVLRGRRGAYSMLLWIILGLQIALIKQLTGSSGLHIRKSKYLGEDQLD